MRVHLLTEGFASPNGRAFLFPLLVWRRSLEEAGYALRLYREATPDLSECDLLLVDSKYHRREWVRGAERIVEQFARWRRDCPVVYFDTTDSTGYLQTELLPVVDLYCKAQLLRERELYLQPHYGHRIYADYYHRRHAVRDEREEWSTPVGERTLLSKLAVSWNSGLADYSLAGPLRMALYQRLPAGFLLRHPRPRGRAGDRRTIDVSCRFGTRYERATVAWQRCRIRELMEQRVDTGKLPRPAYFRELEASRVVISPFGLGEITLKDFEVFLTGGALMKPDMSHLETWPPFFVGGQTLFSHRWDLEDFEAVLAEALEREQLRRDVAAEGQRRYCEYTSGRDAAGRFVEHFSSLLSRVTGACPR